MSRSLVGHLLLVAKLTETWNDEEYLPLASVFKGMRISFLKFRITFTLTKSLEKSSSHDGYFPFVVKNELIII